MRGGLYPIGKAQVSLVGEDAVKTDAAIRRGVACFCCLEGKRGLRADGPGEDFRAQIRQLLGASQVPELHGVLGPGISEAPARLA